MFSHEGLALDQFDTHDLCGAGASSTVCRATHRPSGAHVVLKRVSVLQRWQGLGSAVGGGGKAVEAEINALRRLRHRHIVRLYSFFRASDAVVLVLEPCEFSLKQMLDEYPGQRMPPRVAMELVAQLADALAHVHAASLIHRDVKPENVLLRKGIVKLADFGSACGDGQGKFTRCGTLDYLAPEVVSGGEPHTAKLDVWALGVTLAELVFGCPPFYTASERGTLHNIVHAAPHLPQAAAEQYALESGDDVRVAHHALSLVHWALQKAPNDRPTAAEFQNALQAALLS